MDLSIYNKTIKIRYQKQPQSLFGLSGSSNIRKWMRTYFPHATKEQHKQLRDQAKEKFEELDKEWSNIVETEFQRLFHRPFEVRDYRVSGIARDEFSAEVKEKLRSINKELAIYYQIANSHDLLLPLNQRL